jgi:hypothetical protein
VVCLDETKEAASWNDDFMVYALGKAKGLWHFHPSLNSWLLNNLPNYDVVISHGLWQYQSFAISKAISQLQDQMQFHNKSFENQKLLFPI